MHALLSLWKFSHMFAILPFYGLCVVNVVIYSVSCNVYDSCLELIACLARLYVCTYVYIFSFLKALTFFFVWLKENNTRKYISYTTKTLRNRNSSVISNKNRYYYY